MTGTPSTFAEARATMDAAREKNKTKAGRIKPLSKRARELLSSMGLKRCPTCLSIREWSAFHSDASKKDGLSGLCKVCTPAKSLAYNEAHRDVRAVKARGYHRANRDRILPKLREYHHENRDARLAQMAVYKSERTRIEPFWMRLAEGANRARRLGLRADTITTDELLAWWRWAGIDPNVDYFTGEPLGEGWCIDHYWPLVEGSTVGHQVTNLVPVSKATNTRKGSMDPDEFRALLGLVS